MPHHVYTTPGFIVKSSSHAEAGKFFNIFTRDLGMIGATAQGVRLNQSKLRYHSQDYVRSFFSLVRGKEVWRLTGASGLDSSLILIEKNRRLYMRVLSLLSRLLPGEDKNENLFETFNYFYEYLCLNDVNEDEDIIECLTVIRILYHLGYVNTDLVLKEILLSKEINPALISSVRSMKASIVKLINNALKESQL